MKIIFKIISAGSGSDAYFERLSKALNNLGHKTKIIYFNKYFQFIPFLIPLLNQRDEQADIIHSNIDYGWVFKNKNIPLILTAHHNVINSSYQKYTSFFQKIYHYLIVKPNIKKSLKDADTIIAVSNFTKKSFIKIFGYSKKFKVIYNGINLNLFKSLGLDKYHQDGKTHLIFVGNLIKRKGVDLLPKIMKKLGKNYVLHYTNGLRTKTPKNFELKNMFSLGKPSTENLVKEYNKCDALLFPTRLEGFGYVVIEAIACGIPAITSNCSSLTEIALLQKGCNLCSVDNVDDFVNKIKNLSNYQNSVDTLKINKEFSEKFWIEKTVKLYRSYL